LRSNNKTKFRGEPSSA